MAGITVESVEEYRDATDTLIGIRILGAWTHPVFSGQAIREYLEGTQLIPYINAPNDEARTNIVKGIATGVVNRERAKLDARDPPPSITVIEYDIEF